MANLFLGIKMLKITKMLFDSLKKLKLLKIVLNFKVTQQYVKVCLNMPKVLCVVLWMLIKPA